MAATTVVGVVPAIAAVMGAVLAEPVVYKESSQATTTRIPLTLS